MNLRSNSKVLAAAEVVKANEAIVTAMLSAIRLLGIVKPNC